MVKVAKSLTVPQIFFNDRHIGGASELLELPKEDFLAFIDEVDQAGDPENLEIFSRPSTAPAPAPVASPRRNESIQIGDQLHSFVQSTILLEKEFGSKRFSKVQLEQYLKTLGGNSETGKDLFEFGVIVKVDGDFMLPKYASPNNVLNSYRVWNDRIDEPLLVVKLLKKMLSKVVGKYRDSEGLVDYLAAGQDELFSDFEEASCEIQGIKLALMENDARLAFGINLYNLMITHAFIKVGAPTNAGERSKFFPVVSYNVGGDVFSFSTLENGVLRGNKPAPPFYLKNPIGKKDPRINAVLEMDNLYMVHFALNCGAKSCPPIKTFSAEAVHEELEIVATAFLEQSQNCSVDESTGTLTLSKILSWYASDFGSSKTQIALTVKNYLNDDDAAAVQRIVDSGKLKIKYSHYDWSSDAKRTVTIGGSACIIS